MEKFFQAVGFFGEEEITLFISKIGFELSKEIEIGTLCKTILKMAEEKRKEEVRQQWIVMLPFMSLGMLKYMPFEEYYAQCSGKNLDLRPTEDILNDVENIRRQFERKEN